MTTQPRRIVARSPEDLLALVPYVLGFLPEDSLVMLGFGDGQFHARIDLPGPDADLDGLLGCLVTPVRRQGVRTVALVAYTSDPARAEWVTSALEDRLGAWGVRVHSVLRVEGSRWFPLGPDAELGPRHGVPFDPMEHEFTALSVYEGRVTHGSREDLAASLVARDAEAVEAVEAAVMQVTAERARGQGVADRSWARRCVARHASAATRPSADETGRLLVACCDVHTRDALWHMMSLDDAPEQVRFWTDVVRRTPVDLLAAPATLLASAAWLSGHGALAWCALDRAALAEPGYGMAEVVASLLQQAVPPHAWAAMRAQAFDALDEDA